jgi:hypothetical protein
VADWLGNTPDVADKHYLQVTAEHFERATASGAGACEAAEGGARGDEMGGAEGGTAREGGESPGEANPVADQDVALELCEVSHDKQTHPEGLEPPTLGSEDRCSIQLSYGCSHSSFDDMPTSREHIRVSDYRDARWVRKAVANIELPYCSSLTNFLAIRL